ncbi:MAG: polysaccharide deacetylase family protein, partial [Candidatus Goldbacteria bacterium]|nr:polysaccharide deacetylase family protein [Candidatus Goldiibacteriota bacterium]
MCIRDRYIYSVFFGGKNNLNEENIKEMSKYNIDIGCHSWSHPVLTKRKASWTDDEYLSFLEKEIIKSKIFFESKLKIPMETYAYPYGLYSKEVIYMIKKAGYRAAFSVVPGVNTSDTPRYALHRTLIFNSTGVESLKKILLKKPIKVKDVYPMDSDIIEDKTPIFSVSLVDDSKINTSTIKFKLNSKELKNINYDFLTKKITCQNGKPLSNGVYVVTINAKGFSGEEYEYSWLFVIGKPADTGIY